jgi:hypothetical protein
MARTWPVRFTLEELEALGEACGFRLAGELEDDEDDHVRAVLEGAHEKLTNARHLFELKVKRAKTDPRVALARVFVDQWKALERQETDAVGWLQLKFSCSRAIASRLLDAVEKLTTN